MESPKKITKAQLLEMIQQEVGFQERKKFLEEKISKINDELFALTEGKMGKKSKKDKDEDIDEGLFQNIGRGLSKFASGVGQAGKGIAQQYQKGVDQKSLQYIAGDIAEKEQELVNLKSKFKYLTGKDYNAKTAQQAVAVARNQQGVIQKQPAQKKTATAPAKKKRTVKKQGTVQTTQTGQTQQAASAE